MEALNLRAEQTPGWDGDCVTEMEKRYQLDYTGLCVLVHTFRKSLFND